MLKEAVLRRYTNIPALIQILRTKKLTLLDPSSWDDSNDSHSLNVFKEKKRLETLLALCFTETVETYHHWHVFAGDTSGVCITFFKEPLLACFKPTAGFMHGPVEYKSLQDLRENPPTLQELPFIKRQGYFDEKEYRILYKNSGKCLATKQISIPLECIAKITLSPWIHRSLVKHLRETIVLASEHDRFAKFIFRSTLTGNTEWKEIVENPAL